MARELDPARPPGREVRRAIRSRLRETIDLLESPHLEDPDVLVEAVHGARRGCKEVRALIRLVDSTTTGPGKDVDRATRDAARVLAPVRDAHVARQLAESTATITGGVDPVHESNGESSNGTVHLAAASGPSGDQDDVDERLRTAVRHLRRALALTAPLGRAAGPGQVHDGLRDSYRRAARAYERARHRPTETRLHEWRTWNKRLWYQVRFLVPVAPSVLAPLADLLDDVGETLGDVHDIDVYLSGPDEIGDSQRTELESLRASGASRALRWGATIHAETASAFTRRIFELWRIAAAQGPEPPQ